MSISAFLDHLENERSNGARTRNARLAAIHSLYRFAALRHPDHANTIARVLDIPHKRTGRHDVSFLTRDEIEALLSAPDRTIKLGRRDHAILCVAIQTGLRVSELIALRNRDVNLGAGAHIACTGKGRKQRVTPLTAHTVEVLHSWNAETRHGPDAPLFPGPRGRPLGRDAIRRVVARHVATAASTCPTLRSKNVTPHVLRHTCAMTMLWAGIDTAVIALWLGHETIESTNPYLHADMTVKERALAHASQSPGPITRYQAPDPLLAFLDSL